MVKSPFWTERRFTGLTLILGSVLFQVAAFLPVKDRNGTFIYLLPPKQWLEVVFTHQTLWAWTSVLFMSGTLVTLLGFALLARLLQDTGDRAFSSLGLLALLVGAVLWIIVLAGRLSIDFWAAQETARTGVVPAVYGPLTQWTDVLFVVYTILTFLGAVAYGGALVSTRMLPRWLGWLIIVYSLAALVLVVAFGNAPPLLHHLLPIVLGILLLLPRYQLPAASHRKEGSAVARMHREDSLL